ncbi:MAG: hypothetical protein AB7O48_03100 [Cyclobacteriaceae bacterium]
MKYRRLFRRLMIVAGVLATVVIVLSQALPEVSGKALAEKAKTEQTEKSTEIQIVSAPSDVVPGGSIQINDVDRALLETLVPEEREVNTFQSYTVVLSDLYHVLFRAIISPNAP